MPRKAKTTIPETSLSVIANTAEEPAKKAAGSGTGEQVFIACGMPLGIKFDDVDSPGGGVHAVSFPGVNHAIRGKKTAILLPKGNATLVSISRADWECIKRKHGRERCFVSEPPLLWEMKSESEFKARRDEIAKMVTGVEPVTPESANVERASVNEE